MAVVPARQDEAHYRRSSLREKVIEHLFVGELLRVLWRQGRTDFEVLRAEVDNGGYDLAIECGGVLRHIQLKSSHSTARTGYVNVHINLSAKPSGCVIWILFDPETLELGPFRWLGSEPGVGLGDLGAAYRPAYPAQPGRYPWRATRAA